MDKPENKREEENGYWKAWYLLVLGFLACLILGFYFLKNHFS
jgi:hypothetical protein